MISWKLWAALQVPYVSHPIYQRRGVWKQPRVHPPARWLRTLQRPLYRYRLIWIGLLILLSLLITVQFGPVPLLLVFLGIPSALLLVAVPLLALSMGTLHGLYAAVAVSDQIVVEKLQGRYQLLALTPRGIAGTTWALCSVVFHSHEIYVQVRRMVISGYLAALTLVTLTILPLLILSAVSDPRATETPVWLFWLALGIGIILDFFQSANIGCVTGMLVPSLASGSRGTVRNQAMLSFVTIQLTTYVVVGQICLGLWPQLYVNRNLGLSYAILCLLTLVAVRDLVTLVLWLVLIRYLDTTVHEMDEITGLGLR